MCRLATPAFVLAVSLALVPSAPARAATTVLILSLGDETRAAAAGSLRRASQELQHAVAVSAPSLVPRLIPSPRSGGWGPQSLAELGREEGAAFVVRGGILAVSSDPASGRAHTTVHLYADVVAVSTATVQGLRAAGGCAAGEGIEGAAAPPGFECALSAATAELSRSIVQALTAPAAAEGGRAAPALANLGEEPGGDLAPEDGGEAEAAEGAAEEELAQLVSQAEQYLSRPGESDPQRVARLGAALEKLQLALALKADDLQASPADDTAEIDEQIEASESELQSVVSGAEEAAGETAEIDAEGDGKEPGDEATYETEEGEDLDAGSGEDEPAAGAGGLERATQFVDLVLSTVERIQELRSTLHGERASAGLAVERGEVAEGKSDGDRADEENEERAGTEEELAEVTGVVTRDGVPVEGAVVSDEASGVTATTDREGLYRLEGIPPHLMARLKVRIGARTVGSGATEVMSGRAAVADFPLRREQAEGRLGAGSQAARVLPSVVASPAAKGPTGTVRALVLDAGGRPVARALVRLGEIGVGRTDSRGTCTFRDVVPGTHELTTLGSAGHAGSQRVVVSAGQVAQASVRAVAASKVFALPGAGVSRPHAAGTLRGTVRDTSGRAIAGARVSASAEAAAKGLFALTAATGGYVIRGLVPGSYRVVASKPGYATANRATSVEAGRTTTADLGLKASPARANPYPVPRLGAGAARALPRALAQVAPTPSPTPSRAGVKSSRMPPAPWTGALRRGPGQQATAELRGEVTDLVTGKGIAGARVSLDGRARATTDSRGAFTLGDLQPGRYRLAVTRAGFSPAARDVTVVAGRSGSTIVKLRPAPQRVAKPHPAERPR